MMWYWGTGVHWWAWGLGVFTTIVFWGLVIWAIAALVGWARSSRRETPEPPGPAGDGPRTDDNAAQTLSQRFAAGEIDAEEYRRRLEVLRSQRYVAGWDRR
jgi:uncharacterized membrane protein